ncbi:MAG: winged helix-turn-helix transcriptional regulator [Anaerovoracaceae bacterium]|jgi:DNA-binding Lrp family transcriptional regulator
MVNEELDILNIVAENPITSQRKIAEETGISLGQVNFLIKKFVKKGLIKIEGRHQSHFAITLHPKAWPRKQNEPYSILKYPILQ